MRANQLHVVVYLGPSTIARNTALAQGRRAKQPEVGTDLPWRLATPRGGTRVHHGRVGSAGLCDLKILHPWRRLKKGVKILQWPPNARKGGQYSTSIWKVCKKGGQKSTILKNIGVKILQVWKWGSKFYMLKNRGQNSTMLEKRRSILYIRPQK